MSIAETKTKAEMDFKASVKWERLDKLYKVICIIRYNE